MLIHFHIYQFPPAFLFCSFVITNKKKIPTQENGTLHNYTEVRVLAKTFPLSSGDLNQECLHVTREPAYAGVGWEHCLPWALIT